MSTGFGARQAPIKARVLHYLRNLTLSSLQWRLVLTPEPLAAQWSCFSLAGFIAGEGNDTRDIFGPACHTTGRGSNAATLRPRAPGPCRLRRDPRERRGYVAEERTQEHGRAGPHRGPGAPTCSPCHCHPRRPGPPGGPGRESLGAGHGLVPEPLGGGGELCRPGRAVRSGPHDPTETDRGCRRMRGSGWAVRSGPHDPAETDRGCRELCRPRWRAVQLEHPWNGRPAGGRPDLGSEGMQFMREFRYSATAD